MQTPPVPSLITTSNSSQKLSNGTPFHQLSSSNMPPLRPKLPSGSRSSHEIITIGDSPVTRNPPPLLPTPSIVTCSISLLLALTHKQNSRSWFKDSVFSLAYLRHVGPTSLRYRFSFGVGIGIIHVLWCGHGLRPNYTLPSCLEFRLGRTLRFVIAESEDRNTCESNDNLLGKL